MSVIQGWGNCLLCLSIGIFCILNIGIMGVGVRTAAIAGGGAGPAGGNWFAGVVTVSSLVWVRYPGTYI